MTETLDAEDAARLALAEAGAVRVTLAALGRVTITSCTDRRTRRLLTARDPAWLTPQERHAVARLAWRYRRQMPRHLTPHINPDDPLSTDRQRLENSDG